MEKFTEAQLRNQLKAILYFFAKASDQPGLELQEILREVITELHEDVSTAHAQAQACQTMGQRTLRLVN